MAQRFTAMVLAVCVVVHLATIIYAVQGGLTAAEILARTRGSLAWAAFYTVFAVTAAIHGGIGLRTIAIEWLAMRGSAGIFAFLAALVVGLMGVRAVAAVVLG